MRKKTRKEALLELVTLTAPLDAIRRDLSQYEWDSAKEEIIITVPDVRKALRLFLEKTLSVNDIEDWANLIEGRDDLGLDSSAAPLLAEILHELANPILTRKLTEDVAKNWLERLH